TNTNTYTALLQAGYHTGTTWEGHAAGLLHEAGITAHDALTILGDAGTPAWDACEGLTYGGYTRHEIETA
ncbi:MAG: hypothetical protein ACT4OX_11710, partial [Actinomycetota bacterium]